MSLADLIVLGGSAAVEQAAKAGGVDVTVPFTPGRVDATDEQTDHDSFEPLEPKADGFRNWLSGEQQLTAEYLLIDRKSAHAQRSGDDRARRRPARARRQRGRLHARRADRSSGVLTNDFFVNLLDLGTQWTQSTKELGTYEARDASGAVKWTGTRVDLVFGSNPSCAPSPRCTPAPMRRPSSLRISPPRSRR